MAFRIRCFVSSFGGRWPMQLKRWRRWRWICSWSWSCSCSWSCGRSWSWSWSRVDDDDAVKIEIVLLQLRALRAWRVVPLPPGVFLNLLNSSEWQRPRYAWLKMCNNNNSSSNSSMRGNNNNSEKSESKFVQRVADTFSCRPRWWGCSDREKEREKALVRVWGRKRDRQLVSRGLRPV